MTPDPIALEIAAEHAAARARLDSILRPHVLAALSAADVPPDSTTGRIALGAAADAAWLVRARECSTGEAVDREQTAAKLVQWAQGETARGVRVVGR